MTMIGTPLYAVRAKGFVLFSCLVFIVPIGTGLWSVAQGGEFDILPTRVIFFGVCMFVLLMLFDVADVFVHPDHLHVRYRFRPPASRDHRVYFVDVKKVVVTIRAKSQGFKVFYLDGKTKGIWFDFVPTDMIKEIAKVLEGIGVRVEENWY
jgi:hypothetical protein